MTPDHQRQLAAKDSEIEGLKARICDLERLVMPETMFPIAWRLTSKEGQLLALIYSRELTRTSFAMDVMYGDRLEPPLEKIIAVYVSKIRKKLSAFGVGIEGVWGVGYRLPDHCREIIRQAIEPKASAA